MKLKSVIRTSKDLKKNGYKMIKKLHKMEKKKGAEKAYKAVYEDTYTFVLYCKELTEVIAMEYGDTDKVVCAFKGKCENFIKYLESIAKTKSRINKSYLAGFLRAYTKFFNRIIEKQYPFSYRQDIIEKWNIGCLMAYVATWGA